MPVLSDSKEKLKDKQRENERAGHRDTVHIYSGHVIIGL
jgi:hypothetical protein